MRPPPLSHSSALVRGVACLFVAGLLSLTGFAGVAEAASHDLAIRMRGSPVKAGQATVLRISVLNLGSATVTSTDAATVVIVLPASFSPPSTGGIFPSSWACVVHGQQATCTYFYGPPVAGRAPLPEISLIVRPNQPGPFSTCAVVSMTTADANVSDNKSCLSGLVKP